MPAATGCRSFYRIESEALILTLHVDAASFAILNGLRQQHFPRERNFLAAHVTLFHQLPGDHWVEIVHELGAIAAETGPMPITFPGVLHLGRGVAIRLECEPLLKLRAELVRVWEPWLTPQDRQGFRPHVTVQNKVDPAESKALFSRLNASWEPFDGTATALTLWWYRGGPWAPAGEYVFARSQQQKQPRPAGR